MNAKQTITNPYVPPKRPVLVAGCNGLPKLVMTAPDGACAEVYLHGAQVTSWIPAGGREWLFVSRGNAFREDDAIRGGVPVIFPQIGSDGRLPRHGFARTLDWELVQVRQNADGSVAAGFQLADSRASWRLWRHRFLFELQVTVGGSALDLRWRVTNTGKKRFRFTAGLHTYLRLEEGVTQARLLGLEGRCYRNLHDGSECTDPEFVLNADDGCGRFYPTAAAPLLLRDGGRTLRITADSLPDVGLWCPSQEEAARLLDLEVDEQGEFIRIETAAAEQPLWLQPGETWQGRQTLIADEPPLLPTK